MDKRDRVRLMRTLVPGVNMAEYKLELLTLYMNALTDTFKKLEAALREHRNES